MEHYKSVVSVKCCSLCSGNTEYRCQSCKKDLCLQCTEKHAIDLDMQHHDLMIYKEKFRHFLKREVCSRHQDNRYTMYCESCEVPVCDDCYKHKPVSFPFLDWLSSKGHNRHKLIRIKSVYETKRPQQTEMINYIRSKILLNLHLLKSELKNDVEICHRKIQLCQSEMIMKGQRLKDLMDRVTVDVLFQHRRKIRKLRKDKNITCIEKYEYAYDKSVHRPVTFLRFIKKTHFPRKQDTPHITPNCIFSIAPEINMEDIIKLLCEIQITERGIRQGENKNMLKMMPYSVLKKSLKVEDVGCCVHISCLTEDTIWVSGRNKIILVDTTTGNTLRSAKNVLPLSFHHSWNAGFHTVNSDSDLLYINKYYEVDKLSNGRKTTTFIEQKSDDWEPQCVYSSPYSGELLVGMRYYDYDKRSGRVNRYSKDGRLKQTIRKGRLFMYPIYIVENTNRDIVVSDEDRGVVVTDFRGRHRFSYLGLQSGPRLLPRGICTDSLSHILVCDANTKTIHMIDNNGQFLSYLLTLKSPRTDVPFNLSFDVKSHLLFVGTLSTVSVYRYINRHLI